ncbi:hypothetical protein BWI97_26470 [Siphonobacter sp. BAB-5405]|nr:hypothetical protein BWI97_26470 [Siphonobacter sp. BAB-5405]
MIRSFATGLIVNIPIDQTLSLEEKHPVNTLVSASKKELLPDLVENYSVYPTDCDWQEGKKCLFLLLPWEMISGF